MPSAEGVFDDIQEHQFLDGEGKFRVDQEGATRQTKSSLLYKVGGLCLCLSRGASSVSASNPPTHKLSYHRFAEAMKAMGRDSAVDVARRADIGGRRIPLRYFEEGYTTTHWLCRIYRVRGEEEVANRYSDLRASKAAKSKADKQKSIKT